MTAAYVALAFVLTLGAVVALAWRVGGSDEREDRAEDARNEAQKQAERMAGPMPGKAARARAALRKLRERGVRVD